MTRALHTNVDCRCPLGIAISGALLVHLSVFIILSLTRTADPARGVRSPGLPPLVVQIRPRPALAPLPEQVPNRLPEQVPLQPLQPLPRHQPHQHAGPRSVRRSPAADAERVPTAAAQSAQAARTMTAPELHGRAPIEPHSSAPDRAAVAPPMLDLKLPSGSKAASGRRNPALDDERANSHARRPQVNGHPAGLDERGTNITGLSQTAMADGSITLRLGRSCVVARPSRAAGLDSFGESSSPKPRPIEGC